MPTGKYEGSTDPEDHCTTFDQHMMLYTDSDAMWCKVFPSIFLGVAASWYKGIEANSIYSFRRLQAAFLARFVSKQKRKKMSGELLSFVQRDREFRRDYLTHFNNESITILNLQQEVAFLALMRGMHDCEFKKYLSRKSYTNLGDVMHKENEYIRGDEMMRISNITTPAGNNSGYISGYNNNQQPAKGNNPSNSQGGNNNYNQNNNQGRGNFKKDTGGNNNPQGGRARKEEERFADFFDNYTPLNTARTTIYNINDKMDGWKKPPPMMSRERNVKKNCDFHNEHGHHTEDCRDLKDNIEDMVKKWYFLQYRARKGNINYNSVGNSGGGSYRPPQQQHQQQYP
ncbi:uncharacterized protein [Spinacia oleracea]|uniref:Retrotransposon gag domain-containing protein n=1 Tax=Spinacia oleracea TaxID=3562 RepID=A0A9R0KAY4_SPIOL|nr:uncharacterized protein LOC110803745 [Spinacia oleracea]